MLQKIGLVLNKSHDRQIVVQGHTDALPILGKLAERYPTNWELSAARAINVVRFLQDEVGIDPARLAPTALSEFRPKADNSSEEGRQKNRRIEILVAPLPVAWDTPEGEDDAAAEPQPEAPGEESTHGDDVSSQNHEGTVRS